MIVISDFLVNASDYEAALTQLVAARHEVKVVHVMGETDMAVRDSAGTVSPPRRRDWGDPRSDARSGGGAGVPSARDRACRTGGKVFCARHGLNDMQAFSAARVDETIVRDFPHLEVIV